MACYSSESQSHQLCEQPQRKKNIFMTLQQANCEVSRAALADVSLCKIQNNSRNKIYIVVMRSSPHCWGIKLSLPTISNITKKDYYYIPSNEVSERTSSDIERKMRKFRNSSVKEQTWNTTYIFNLRRTEEKKNIKLSFQN